VNRRRILTVAAAGLLLPAASVAGLLVPVSPAAASKTSLSFYGKRPGPGMRLDSAS
jgi:hypothetical protein